MVKKLDVLISSCTAEARVNITDWIMASILKLGFLKARKIPEKSRGQFHSVVKAYVSKIVKDILIKLMIAVLSPFKSRHMTCGDFSLNLANFVQHL